MVVAIDDFKSKERIDPALRHRLRTHLQIMASAEEIIFVPARRYRVEAHERFCLALDAIRALLDEARGEDEVRD
jgi:hypothetical protein